MCPAVKVSGFSSRACSVQHCKEFTRVNTVCMNGRYNKMPIDKATSISQSFNRQIAIDYPHHSFLKCK